MKKLIALVLALICVGRLQEKYGSARCAWSYKEMDFGLIDDHLKQVLPEIIGLL